MAPFAHGHSAGSVETASRPLFSTGVCVPFEAKAIRTQRVLCTSGIVQFGQLLKELHVRGMHGLDAVRKHVGGLDQHLFKKLDAAYLFLGSVCSGEVLSDLAAAGEQAQKLTDTARSMERELVMRIGRICSRYLKGVQGGLCFHTRSQWDLIGGKRHGARRVNKLTWP